jgi:predicted transposase YdaD
MIPNPQKYVDEWRREIAQQALAEGQAQRRAEGQAQGRAEGQAKGQAKAILKILAQRKIQLSEDQRRLILECADLAAFDRWLDQAFSIASADELFL